MNRELHFFELVHSTSLVAPAVVGLRVLRVRLVNEVVCQDLVPVVALEHCLVDHYKTNMVLDLVRYATNHDKLMDLGWTFLRRQELLRPVVLDNLTGQLTVLDPGNGKDILWRLALGNDPGTITKLFGQMVAELTGAAETGV